MTTWLASGPPVGALEGDDPRRRRPQVVVFLERIRPASWSLRQLTWFATRLGAELLIAAVVTQDHALDPLDLYNVRIARRGIREVIERLVEQGVRATGEVSLARHGEEALVASDVADSLDADLVIVLARRGTRFGLLPGSPLAHQLMRRRRRPVLVIADHERRGTWTSVLWELVRVHAPEDGTEHGDPGADGDAGPTRRTVRARS